MSETDWYKNEPNPKLEEEARELGQFMIELTNAYRRLEQLQSEGASPEKIEEWLDDLAISTRGIEQTTARITRLVREEFEQRQARLHAYYEGVESL